MIFMLGLVRQLPGARLSVAKKGDCTVGGITFRFHPFDRIVKLFDDVTYLGTPRVSDLKRLRTWIDETLEKMNV